MNGDFDILILLDRKAGVPLISNSDFVEKLHPDRRRPFFGNEEIAHEVHTICHGPWLLVEVGVVSGGAVTSWPSLQTDIRNAGGDWVDREVITDKGLVTSRKPEDIPAFNRKMIEEFGEGIHAERSTSMRETKSTESRAERADSGS